MHFPCVAGCKRSFETAAGLDTHQHTCQYFAADDASLVGLADKFAAKRARKRQRIEERARNEQVDIPFPDAVAPPSIQEELPEPSPEPVRAPSPKGRGRRTKRPTWKILERLPQPPSAVPDVPEHADELAPDDAPAAPESLLWFTIRTAMNAFGLYREYHTVPTHCPDDTLSLDDVSYNSFASPPSGQPTTTSRLAPPIDNDRSPALTTDSSASSTWAPFSNMSVFRLINWMWSGSNLKSISELDKLVHEVILAPDFEQDHFRGFDAKRETDKLDKASEGNSKAGGLPTSPADGWRPSSVEIRVPDGQHHASEKDPPIPTFIVPGLHHRSLIETIKVTWSDVKSSRFHFSPFQQFWCNRSDGDKIERVHDEIYSSDAFIEADKQVQGLPSEPGCTLERTVCALMFWSDSMHLANFGTASLWPLYLFFGNQSKYTRAHPSSGACHHVAYIPKLPDSFFDFFQSLTGTPPSSEVLSHCRRELMHAVLKIMLDADFIDAYQHGIVIKCADGITRRVYPRIFTYSADYPEKVLLATIRNLGACPCPRCTVPKADIPELGMLRDDSRREKYQRSDDGSFRSIVRITSDAIYRLGKGVKSTVVENLLAEKSYVPVELSPFGFDFFPMLVVDLMHEFELGVWKAVFTHLIRILVAYGKDTVQALNQRYRQIPTFGRSTIRRFSDNASAMKKLAARNYEDLLQCALPVFEGLLEEPHNTIVLDLLFGLAEWHAAAKLRMHTDSSLTLLRQSTIYLGSQLRRFVKYTCSNFDTKELPRETAARGRRKRKARSATDNSTTTAWAPPKQRLFNLFTYKVHALGDYVRQILWFSTSDSYSTQPGELEHRRVKRYYARTNKNKAVRQITHLQRREEALHRMMRGHAVSRQTVRGSPQKKAVVDFDESEPLPSTPPEDHHHISHSRKFPLQLSSWLAESVGDLATKDFIPKLQDHILKRLLHPDAASEGRTYSDEQRSQIIFQNGRLFRHKVFRVNYTTYDVRRGQDSMNPRRHADIMTLLRDDNDDSARWPNTFSFARVLGVFHADILVNIPGSLPTPKAIEFLWVRWFHHDARWPSGFKKHRFHRVHFLPDTNERAYGFLDPDNVIRGAHLIPAFAHGRDPGSDEWKFHYVNFFVDRDMYMRYRGIGVGHFYQAPPEAVREGLTPDENGSGNNEVVTDAVAINVDATEDEIAEDQAEDSDTESEDEDVEGDFGPEDGDGDQGDAVDREGYGEE